ncbi:hypothetical protein F4809DRAFT_302927 [Biscogniauxia mediterranea]|nr:hypothetical protein F4809DRAFT_302927 [Biscogniauxia mediterranea]
MIVKSEPFFGFLIILAAICEIYKEPSAGGATISSAIVDTPFQPPVLRTKLDQVNWATADDYVTVNRHTAIGLIGYFETATNIIEGIGEDDFRIIGLSGGDSIFVPTADPQEKCPDYYFTRILGNTGQPGVSMLVLPTKLDARKVDPGAWRVEPVKFDGTALDSFRNTSLHLSFTEWSTPIVQFQAVG